MCYSLDLKDRTIKTYYKMNYTIRKIANILEIGKSSISRWIRLYKTNKTNSALTNKNKGRKTTLTNQQNDQICNFVINNNLITIHELQNLVLKNLHIKMSKSTLYRLLKKNKLSYKSTRTIVIKNNATQLKQTFKT